MTHELSDHDRPSGGGPLPAEAPAAHGPGVAVRGATSIIPQKLITEGEVVILAVKPSLWFIVLVSGRWLLVSLLAIIAVELAKPYWTVSHGLAGLIEQVAILAVCVRLLVGALEWLGRVYVLTDRRVMRLRGVVHIDLFECPLSRIQQAVLALPLPERALFCGTILFYTAGTDAVDAAWQTMARPAQAYQAVLEAMERYRSQNP